MTKDWVTIRVPETDRDTSQDIRPEDATHGDCLVAGAKALASGGESGDVPDRAPDEIVETLHEQLGALEDGTADVDETEIAREVEDRLRGSKPLAEMEFEDWFEPDYARTIADEIEAEMMLGEEYAKHISRNVSADLKAELPALIAEELQR